MSKNRIYALIALLSIGIRSSANTTKIESQTQSSAQEERASSTLDHAIKTVESILEKYYSKTKLTAMDVIVLKAIGFTVNPDIAIDKANPALKNAIQLFNAIVSADSFGIDAKSVDALVKNNALINPHVDCGGQNASWKACAIKILRDIPGDSVEFLSALKTPADCYSAMALMGGAAKTVGYFWGSARGTIKNKVLIPMYEADGKTQKTDHEGNLVYAEKEVLTSAVTPKASTTLGKIFELLTIEKVDSFGELVGYTGSAFLLIAGLSQAPKACKAAPGFVKKNFPSVYKKISAVHDKVKGKVKKS